MIRTMLLAASATAFLFTAAPAFAACESELKATQELFNKSTDTAKKTAASEKMKLASAAMAKQDEVSCMAYLKDAQLMLGK